jgi:hypothetical protein
VSSRHPHKRRADEAVCLVGSKPHGRSTDLFRLANSKITNQREQTVEIGLRFPGLAIDVAARIGR